MSNKDIRLEWVPSAYRDDVKSDGKTIVKTSTLKTTLYSGKGIYAKQGIKRKNVDSVSRGLLRASQ